MQSISGLLLGYLKSLLTTKCAKVLDSLPKSPLLKGEQEDLGVSPPLEKGAGGISFHTVAWLHLFAPFVYFVVPLSLKAFSLQSSVHLPEQLQQRVNAGRACGRS